MEKVEYRSFLLHQQRGKDMSLGFSSTVSGLHLAAAVLFTLLMAAWPQRKDDMQNKRSIADIRGDQMKGLWGTRWAFRDPMCETPNLIIDRASDVELSPVSFLISVCVGGVRGNLF